MRRLHILRWEVRRLVAGVVQPLTISGLGMQFPSRIPVVVVLTTGRDVTLQRRSFTSIERDYTDHVMPSRCDLSIVVLSST